MFFYCHPVDFSLTSKIQTKLATLLIGSTVSFFLFLKLEQLFNSTCFMHLLEKCVTHCIVREVSWNFAVPINSENGFASLIFFYIVFILYPDKYSIFFCITWLLKRKMNVAEKLSITFHTLFYSYL